MKKFALAFIILAVAAFSFSSAASAQSNTVEVDAKIQFLTFDNELIEGSFKSPNDHISSVRQQARFERSANLKKSFLSQIQDNAQE